MKNIAATATSIAAACIVVSSPARLAASAQAARAPQSDAAPTIKTMTFVCDDKSTLTIEFISSATPGSTSQAHVMLGTSAWTLPQVRSGSGARYAAYGVSVWNKGDDILFERGGTKLNCRTAGGELVGSNWHLVEFRSSDDKTGVVRPDDPSKYTLTLGLDGRASMRLDCNRGAGPWSSHATSTDSGSFSLGPLAVTRAFCAPPSLDQKIAGDVQNIRSYVLRDGRLFLNLMADGGTYVWARN